MIQNTPAGPSLNGPTKQKEGLQWPSQSPAIIQVEVLWYDLKQPPNVDQFKRFCKDKWVKNSSTVMQKTRC